MISEKYVFNPGGKGANQAAAISLLGGNSIFAGKVGSDSFGSMLRQALEGYGVCTDFLTVSKENQSGFAVIMLEEKGQNRIIVHRAANLDLTKADIDEAFKHSYDAMIIQFEISEEVIIHACKLAKSKGIPFIVDAGPAQAFPLEKIYGIDILSPNETETELLCDIKLNSPEDYLKASQIMAARSGAKHVVLKLGEQGSCLYTNGKIKLFPAHKVNAIDSTAAGDVFTAALTIQYLKSGDIEKAIQYANIAGALTVTKPGALQSIPNEDEVKAVSNTCT